MIRADTESIQSAAARELFPLHSVLSPRPIYKRAA